MDNARLAASKFLGSIVDSPARAIANTAIAMDNAIIVFLAFLAIPLTAIKAAKQALSAPIARIACFKPSGFIKLIIAMAAANNKKATPICIIIVPAFAACFPESFETAIKAIIRASNAAMTSIPLNTSSGDRPAIILIVTAISNKATPIC